MVDEFYLDVNLELFVQWLFGNKNKYDHNILCTLKSNEPYGKTITFNYYNISGSIVIWVLETANVVGTPGEGFGPCGKGYFRLTAFGDAARTKEAAARIKAALAAL